MTRYYFYQADYYITEVNNPGDDREGGNQGIWVVEDDSTPDLILESILKWLYEQWEKQQEAAHQAARANNQPVEPLTIYYLIKQFNKVE
jgi:hypothetical protein